MGSPKQITLRYPGVCEVCGAELRSGAKAWHDAERKKVRCLSCTLPEAGGAHAIGRIERGTAGASAQRQAERRRAQHAARVEREAVADAEWRKGVKAAHPVLGRLAAGLTLKPSYAPEPQRVRAWRSGADGERKVGARLDEWASASICRIALHDRRIPGTRANIDHLAVTAAGVWVIDAKEYAGRVEQLNAGTVFRPDIRLRVGGRDRTRLADGVLWQMETVARVLARAYPYSRLPVFGMLCFVEAEWGLFSKPFVYRGVHVCWPTAAVHLLATPGGAIHDEVIAVGGVLANALPVA